MGIKCPYCLEPIDKGSVIYSCPQCGQRYKAKGILLKKMPICTNKNAHASTLVASKIGCPHTQCGETLPSDYLDYDKSLTFSLVGTTNSGKTNFLIVMLHELMHTLKLGLAISSLDTTKDYYNNFKLLEKEMFENHKIISATNAGKVEPYLWRIRNRNAARGSHIPSYSLTIYDGAGENFDRIDVSDDTIISKYLCDTETLFILIDPLQLPTFKSRHQNNESSYGASDSQDAAKSLEKIVNYLHINKSVPTDQLFDINVAIIFTKIDAITDEDGNLPFSDSDLILQRGDSNHIGCYDFVKGYFDLNQAETISNSIHNYILENEVEMENLIYSNFKKDKVFYFAVSALGNKPIDNNLSVQHIDPIRILDPFLWMMMRQNIVKGGK